MNQQGLLREFVESLDASQRELLARLLMVRLVETATMQRDAGSDREYYGRVQELAEMYQAVTKQPVDQAIKV